MNKQKILIQNANKTGNTPTFTLIQNGLLPSDKTTCRASLLSHHVATQKTNWEEDDSKCDTTASKFILKIAVLK